MPADDDGPTYTDHELLTLSWRHADGGLYRILNIKGQIRQNHANRWERHIEYDHADGTQSMGPYHTGLQRFLDRFTPAEWSFPQPE
jgi:hypothetical protein